MALFNRQKHSDVPPELQPYYDAPTSGPRGWLMWLVRILALLIVLALLFIGGRWAWQKIDNNDKKVGTTQATKQQADKKQSNTTSSATTNSGSSDDTASPSTPPATATPPATSNTATTTPSSTSTTLANTGPGDSVALFVLVAATGIIGYQVFIRLRKTA